MSRFFLEFSTVTEEKLIRLKMLIEQRQKFEHKNAHPPYSLHTTDLNFTDINGNALLHYAAMTGDLHKVKYYLKEKAEINLKNSMNKTPIYLALENGHLAVAQYLFENGASCAALPLTCCKDDICMEWLRGKIKNALEQSYPNPAEQYTYPCANNQFFGKSIDYFFAQDALVRAIEIGDMGFIKSVIDKHKIALSKVRNGKSDLDSLLITAVKNGQLEIIKYLIANGADINSKKNYTDTPLIEAMASNNPEVIHYLLTLNVDVNQEDNSKITALTYAIVNNNKTALTQLLEKGASVTNININGNTLLHIAVASNSMLLSHLLTIPGIEGLAEVKNIYGKTPLDLAIENKNDEAIQLLKPNKALALIKNDPRYGVKPIDIAQNRVLRKMAYRLNMLYRNTEYFQVGGHCNGFAFLKSFYAAKGMEQYYFDTLALMANWDGEEHSLYKPFNNIPQATYYKNLDALFEQWTNDVIWFQHSALSDIDQLEQSQRLEQYLLIQGNDNYVPCFLYREPNFLINENNSLVSLERTVAQLSEIFTYFMRMPEKTHFQLSGGQHATSSYKSDDNIFVYFDPNFTFKTENTGNLDKNIQRIIDYKYILLDKFDGKAECCLSTFVFKKDLLLMNLDDFTVFNVNELPKSHDEAVLFQKNSANQFTHLHIAVLTRSFKTFQQLLKDGHCDVNAKDAFGRSVLQMAIDSGSYDVVRLLFNLETIKADFDRVATQAYRQKQMDIVDICLDSPRVNNMRELLFAAIEENDLDLIKKLVTRKIVDINQVDSEFRLPLISAIERGYLPGIQYFLECGADILATNGSVYNERTPLMSAMKVDSCCLELVISQLKDINQLDTTGKAAIHHAVSLINEKAIAKLIEKGVNVRLQTTMQRNVFDCLNKNLFVGADKKTRCLKLLIPNYAFDLTNHEDKKILNDLFIDNLEGNTDEELFTVILDQCNAEHINQIIIDGKSLLIQCLIADQSKKIEPLLKKGAFIDPLTSTGNTPLMGCIIFKTVSDRYELISLFLRHKSDVTIKNKEGKTAIDLVNESDDEKLKQMFIEHGLILTSFRYN